ncbi:MAG: DEAD/DEAH box helicase [Candidatus Thorarchaeota archaeon]|nr:DEAD/DEAH box helicase [Candidatus Thorarchaeota archaeon]
MSREVQFVQMPLIREQTLEERTYQTALAEIASKESTMIVLSTGLGKTVIAALVAAKQLAKCPSSKVLFLAPSRPLVDQQARFLRRALELDEDRIVSLTGQDSPEHRKDSWASARVAVMTPQALQNDLIQRNYDLGEVSLIVYDEAHRGVGNYAYTFIAEMYEKQRDQRLSLGITASPGQDTDKIVTVCRNLRLSHVEVRTETSPDVRKYVVSVKSEVRHITLPSEIEVLRDMLQSLLADYVSPVVKHGFSLPDLRRVSKREILRVQGEVRRELGSYVEPPAHLYLVMRNLTAALRIVHLLEFVGTQGLEPTHRYVQGMYEEVRNKKASKGLRDLMTRSEFAQFERLLEALIAKGQRHPKADELVEIVSEQLSVDKDSRILVFTRFRDTAAEVARVIEELEDARVSRFVGQGSKGSDKGFTQRKQVEVLDGFRNNEFNVLVATQVGEEGLDIPECNLVVFYDCVPSIVPYIQRKGRTGRKMPGRIVVFVARNTHDEYYYWSVVSKLKRMPSMLKNAERESDRVLKSTEGEPERGVKSTEGEPKREQTTLDSFGDMGGPDSGTSTTTAHQKKDEDIIRLIVDTRELPTAVARELTRLGVEVYGEALEVGDYVASEEVAIERKETSDFVQSLIDGRLFVQLTALRSTYRRPVLIVEGERLIGQRAVNPASIYGALASIAVRIQVPILWSMDGEETANIIYRIARMEQVDSKRVLRIRAPESKASDAQVLEYILSGFPGIDSLLSRAILEEFGTLENVFNADEEALRRVRGVGPKTAGKLKRTLKTVYPGHIKHEETSRPED